MVDYRDVTRNGARLILDSDRDLDPDTRRAHEAVAEGRARKEDWARSLADQHGDIEDAKAAMVLIADEEGFELEPEDVETVTDEPPTATFL